MTKRRNKLLLLAVFGALAIPLLFAGIASAKYVGDGATQNATNGGWDLPKDKGFCVTGIRTDNTMVIDLSVGNNRNDCLAKIWPSYGTSAACLAAPDPEGSHFWLSTCISGSNPNVAISLSGLDRTRYMCEQNSGTWKQACTSSWYAMGPAWSNAPTATSVGATRTTYNTTDGFCYTTIRVQDVYDNTTCPVPSTGVYPGTGILGYRLVGAVSNACAYTYGLVGTTATATTTKTGTARAIGTAVDLTTDDYKNQGACLQAGFQWGVHTNAGGTATVGAQTIASPITSVRAGCLSCHNTTTQYNSMSGRWKDSYLKQGHKGMLRKVTAPKPWGGPKSDGTFAIYTDWFLEVPPPPDESGSPGGESLGTFNWADGTITSNGVEAPAGTYPLMYIAGAMNEVLEPIIWDTGALRAKLNVNEGDYGCAACHVTGFSNPAAGICVVGTAAKPTSGSGAVTSKGACDTAGGTWYHWGGVQSNFPAYPFAFLGTIYSPGQPGQSWLDNAMIAPYVSSDNSIAGITGRWDFDGITCNRCHKVAYDPTFPINDEGANAPEGFTTHETDIFDGWKCVATCFGCHQSISTKNNNTSRDTDLLHPEAVKVSNAATAPAYKPYNSNHTIGPMFLNSAHARYTGTVLPNSVGKYDLVPGGTFNSAFVGYLCRSSTAVGGGSILESQADGEFIKTRADCNRANGKAPGDDGNYGYWQTEPGDSGQGSCITCHNVHVSLFLTSEEPKEPLRRECTTCHSNSTRDQGTSVPQVNFAATNHPTGGTTPDGLSGGDTNKACEICHMPSINGGLPMHLWRISTDVNYSTFPTALEFGIGGTATRKIANTAPDGSYANAVWLDVDAACGQCHGGSLGETATNHGGNYKSKNDLALLAANIHNSKPLANFITAFGATTDNILVNGSSSTCPSGPGNCTFTWAWGDLTADGSGVSTSHVYATGGTKTITLTVEDTVNNTSGTKSRNVNVYKPDQAPVAGGTLTFNDNTWAATIVDSSTDDVGVNLVAVNWGDGTMLSRGAAGDTFNHTYMNAGTFTITQQVFDSAGQMRAKVYVVSPAPFSISRRVVRSDNTTPVAMAAVSVKKNGSTVRTVYTSATGDFSVGNLKPATYDLYITKPGFTFAAPAATITVGPSSPRTAGVPPTGNDIAATSP